MSAIRTLILLLSPFLGATVEPGAHLGAIEGVVTDQKGPVKGALIEACMSLGPVAKTWSADGGHYRLAGLSPGRYSLWVHAPSRDQVWIPSVPVEPAKTTRQDIYIAPLFTAIPSACEGAKR